MLGRRELTRGALATVAAALLVAGAGCRKRQRPGGVEGPSGKLTIVGSTTLLEVSQKWAEAFEKKHPAVRVSVAGGGSGVGIKTLLNESCDVANASRKAKEKEHRAASAKGMRLHCTVVAKDGIAVIVNPANPVTGLEMSELKGLFQGHTKDWSRLSPGFDRDVVVINRESTSGTYGSFQELALDKEEFMKGAKEVQSNAAVVQTVATTPGGIGYCGLGYYENAKDKVKGLAIDGVAPSVKTVVDGSYPISRDLNCYTNGMPDGLEIPYFDFVLGREGQKIVREMDFVPLQ
ncbi:MAG: phosphate ABC transporter substrate-binding protein PstS family protein [Candidatus Eisenbacteria bacterium]|nr:phosphate ABC transporter substrate-binding protein PstS family protein [Candidatus Eisenbacteria bacterium]